MPVCSEVLILVLVEDGLGAYHMMTTVGYMTVLILVLVEDGLGVTNNTLIEK